jgi:hypothetical protein
MEHRYRTRKALVSALLIAAPLLAAAQPPQLGLRQLHNVSHFQTVRQQALELRLPGRDRLQVAGRLFALDWVMATGTIRWDDGSTRFVSVGRGIRWRPFAAIPRSEVQISLSPTWVEHPVLAGRELGGHFHFTTAVAWVLPLDAAGGRTLALRLQHTSNAGSQRENPGLDLAGLELGWRFGRSPPLRVPPRPPLTFALDLRSLPPEPLSPYQPPG